MENCESVLQVCRIPRKDHDPESVSEVSAESEFAAHPIKYQCNRRTVLFHQRERFITR